MNRRSLFASLCAALLSMLGFKRRRTIRAITDVRCIAGEKETTVVFTVDDVEIAG